MIVCEAMPAWFKSFDKTTQNEILRLAAQGLKHYGLWTEELDKDIQGIFFLSESQISQLRKFMQDHPPRPVTKLSRREWGGVKFRIFTLTYSAQFWSYEHVANMFLVRFDLKKHLRTISEHSEHHKHILAGLNLLHGVKQGSSRNFHIFQGWRLIF